MLCSTYEAWEAQRRRERARSCGGILALLKRVEARDEPTGFHIERMTLYSLEIARLCGITDADALDEVFFTAILHDVGKVLIQPEVLNKPGPLTSEERRHIQTHAQIGAEIVMSMEGWKRIGEAVGAHHEWWDGTGYPNRLAGEAIPFAARIVAVADVFDALTSERPYRPALTLEVGIDHIARESDTHFDPRIIDAFTRHPLGKWREIRARAQSLSSSTLLSSYAQWS